MTDSNRNPHSQQKSRPGSEQSSQRFEGLPGPPPFDDPDVLRTLDDDLVVRRASAADIEAVSRFNEIAHADPPAFRPDASIRLWTEDLMDGSHPTARASDFVVVEDTRRKRIASTIALLRHRMRYGGVEFPAAQIELVGTHPDYRRRGLVALQIDLVHARSEERGDLLQLVNGIAWYYRQFGYDMAIESGASRVLYGTPAVPTSEPSPYRVRPATPADGELCERMSARGQSRELLCCVLDADFLSYWIGGRQPGSTYDFAFRIVEGPDGPVAAFGYRPFVVRGLIHLRWIEVAPGTSWQAVAPVAISHVRTAGEEIARRAGNELLGVNLSLGSEHPLYDAVRVGEVRPPYAYYARVPDLVGFLHRVAPALEKRLADSPFAGHTGTAELSFYRRGVRLVFQAGKLAGAESFQPSTDYTGDLAIPDLRFLGLLFGFRTLKELEAAHPDCLVWRQEAAALVDALFPRRSSNLLLSV